MKIQKDRILQFLNENEWVCGARFLDNYISEYRTRINELRLDGFRIETRKCQNPIHKHRGGLREWRLKSSQTLKIDSGEEILPFGLCCYSFYKFGTHDRNCESLKVKEVHRLF